MIKIIGFANRKYSKTCNSCGCEFIYEKQDIEGNSIECPVCGKNLQHIGPEAGAPNPIWCNHRWERIELKNASADKDIYRCSVCGEILPYSTKIS